LKYSPFKTKENLFNEFKKIDNSSGTLVIIFNLKLDSNSKPLLHIDHEKKDILIHNEDEETIKELGWYVLDTCNKDIAIFYLKFNIFIVFLKKKSHFENTFQFCIQIPE
jgi:hypothetical protein